MMLGIWYYRAYLLAPTELVLRLNQLMYAVGADKANHNGANGARHIARVAKGIGHGQNACAQRALEQVKKGFPVTAMEDNI